MGKALEYDVSLLERLYTSNTHPGTVKTMLNVSVVFDYESDMTYSTDTTTRCNTDSRAN